MTRARGVPPLVLGHRGARHAAPENTHAAFDLARREGAAGIELDVRALKSGEVVVAHDPALSRVTGGADTRVLEACKLAELAAVDLGQGEKLPLLADVLDFARQHELIVNVEVKSDVRRRRELLTAVIELLRAHPYAQRGVILSSFDPRFIWRLVRALPQVPSAFLFHRKSPLALAASWVGTSQYRRLGARALHPEHVLVTESTMQRFRAMGALVGAWTVNDEARARSLASLGVDYLVSDRPGAIAEAVRLEPQTSS